MCIFGAYNDGRIGKLKTPPAVPRIRPVKTQGNSAPATTTRQFPNAINLEVALK